MARRNPRALTLGELVVCVVIVAVLTALAAMAFKTVAYRAEDTVARHALMLMARQGYLLAVMDTHERFDLTHFDAALDDFNGEGAAATSGMWAAGNFTFTSASTGFGEVSRGVTVDGVQAALVMRTASGACASAHVDMAGTMVSFTAPTQDCSAQWLLTASGAVPGPVSDPPPATGDPPNALDPLDAAPGRAPDPPPLPGTSNPGPATPTQPGDAAPPTAALPGAEFGGFEDPVRHHPLLNSANAGQAIPLRFSLGGFVGFDVFAPGSPHAHVVDCESRAEAGDPVPAASPGQSGLSYSGGTGRYQWVWKTESAWAGSCVRLAFEFADGTTAWAYFSFKGRGPRR